MKDACMKLLHYVYFVFFFISLSFGMILLIYITGFIAHELNIHEGFLFVAIMLETLIGLNILNYFIRKKQ